jgi:deoxyadenosine/deoxycytidine kinase
MPVIFLSGPIGVGKSTLGQALTRRLGGTHVEGDDFHLPDRP